MLKGAFFTFLLLVCGAATGQWERLPGPVPDFEGPTGSVTCIATNDTFVWIGTENSGVFRTETGLFANWQPKNQGMHTFTIYSLNYENGLLLATTKRGIYKSADGGNNWTSINTGLPIERVINSFTSAGGVLLAATADYGVFRSANNGQSWQKANNGLLDNNTIDLETDGTNFWALTFNAGLFKSTDGGQSWQHVAIAGGCDKCFALEIIDTTVFLAGGNLLVSRNGGKNWNTDTTLKNITGIAAYKGRLIAHSLFRAYESTDTGNTWLLDWEFNVDSTRKINCALATPAEVKYIGTTEKGIYRGSIAAVTWKPYNQNLLTGNIKQLEWHNGKLYTIAFGGLHQSTDRGMTWAEVSPAPAVTTFIIADGVLLAGTDTHGIFTANAQMLWQPTNSGLDNRHVLKLLQRGNSVYALTKGGIFRSPNAGQVWVKYCNPIDTLQFTELWFDNGTVYAGTNWGIYKSTNDGGSFSLVSPDIPRRFVYFFRRINGKLWLEIGIDTHVSADGAVWPKEYYTGGITFANSLSLVGSRLYASTNSGYVFKDTAATQWNFMTTIGGLPAHTFAQGDSFLYAGTGAGVWRLPATSVVAGINGPDTYTPNIYPNPASSRVFISGDENYTLELFTLTGQKIRECVDCSTLNLETLPAGMYLLKIWANNTFYTHKLLVE